MARKHGRRSSAWVRSDLRWAIYVRDSFVCSWCGVCAGENLTLDHLFHKTSPYRDNDPSRLVTACFSCNTSRKDVRLSAWLKLLRAGGMLGFALLALKRRHQPLRRDVGAWAHGAFGRNRDGDLSLTRTPVPATAQEEDSFVPMSDDGVPF